MSISSEEPQIVWREPIKVWAMLLAVAALSAFVFHDGLKQLVEWWQRPEYSHGYLIPIIALFLVWQKKDILERTPFEGSWSGSIVVLMGVLLFFAGELSALYTIIQYAFIILTMGIALSIIGWRGFRIIWVPLVILTFMVPLPPFFYNNLSTQLQLISSQLGVAVIRLFDISVYLEGNVIDLGTYKLQVVDACSGLRYLFPLMTLGFIAAYIYKAAFWKRAVVFLSSIPITIFMNSFRIGIIGILVDMWGRSMAEGFLHFFEGWVVFMACTGILILEMWILTHVGGDRKLLRDVFGLEFPASSPADAEKKRRPVPVQLTVAIVILAVAAVLTSHVNQRTEIMPARTDFSGFPMIIGQWEGMRDQMEHIYVEALKFDDYILADFVDHNQNLINFYAAYYRSQRKGESAHSPSTCIPGGGWEISSTSQRYIDGVTVQGRPLRVNRLVIGKGDSKQLVYYWFQERGRVITNEYLVKWYLFIDALTRNRTDGSLVRITTPVNNPDDIADSDKRLAAFAKLVVPLLSSYIPE